jgi:hypothetical protein
MKIFVLLISLVCLFSSCNEKARNEGDTKLKTTPGALFPVDDREKIEVKGTIPKGPKKILRPFAMVVTRSQLNSIREKALEIGVKKENIKKEDIFLETDDFLEFSYGGKLISIIADKFVITTNEGIFSLQQNGALNDFREILAKEQ